MGGHRRTRKITDAFLHNFILCIISLLLSLLNFLFRYLFFIADQSEITAHPQSVMKTEGENVTLSCNATGNPAPTVSWTKDGSPISNNSRISLSGDNKQLTIRYVSRTDSGEYECVADNSLGNDTSNAATLDVKCKCDLSLVCRSLAVHNHWFVTRY